MAQTNKLMCFWDGTQKTQTLTARNAGGAQRMPDKQHFQCVIETWCMTTGNFAGYGHNLTPTLMARDYKDPTIVAFKNEEKQMGEETMKYIVRRLTPTECARLQGFPDRWGDIDEYETLDDNQYQFWLDVRKTFDSINGRSEKNYTREQIRKWHNGLHTDSSEYKMWGNGIALPCFEFVMQGIQETKEYGD